jgi:hypothetical protein
MVERGPPFSTAIRQPATMITGTDRQNSRSSGRLAVFMECPCSPDRRTANLAPS